MAGTGLPGTAVPAASIPGATSSRRAFSGSPAQLGLVVELPAAPDHELDPKQVLHKLLNRGRRRPSRDYGFFGEQVSLEKLRRLSAFREFEAELTQLVQSFGPGPS
jgi:hypothetical protein